MEGFYSKWDMVEGIIKNILDEYLQKETQREKVVEMQRG